MPKRPLLGCLLAFALMPTPGVAVARDVHHTEACNHNGWGYLFFSGQHFGTTNGCTKTITVWFMTRSTPMLVADVAPGAVFDTGLSRGEFDDQNWVYASCPAGYAPSPALSQESWDQIVASRYVCVRK